jgi:fructokinase
VAVNKLRVLVFGEILWDCFTDRQTLGGASLNFAVHAHRLGHDVILTSAVGKDALGAAARDFIDGVGLSGEYLQATGTCATGHVTVFLDRDGQPDFTIHRPAAYDEVELSEEEIGGLAAWRPDWLYYGTLSSMAGKPRRLLARLVEALPGARRFYDVNLRQDSYTPELVAELIARANVVKLNEDEMAALSGMFDLPASGIEEFCRAGAARFGWQAAAVTLGERGCGVWAGGAYAEAEGVRVTVVDAVGAGDAFSAAFVHGLSLGWPPEKIGQFANRVGALVASRPGGTPEWRLEEVPSVGLAE